MHFFSYIYFFWDSSLTYQTCFLGQKAIYIAGVNFLNAIENYTTFFISIKIPQLPSLPLFQFSYSFIVITAN
jgi:hypothetical protein